MNDKYICIEFKADFMDYGNVRNLLDDLDTNSDYVQAFLVTIYNDVHPHFFLSIRKENLDFILMEINLITSAKVKEIEYPEDFTNYIKSKNI